METIAKLFTNGRSQRSGFRKPVIHRGRGGGDSKGGDALILLPVRKSWESYADEAPAVDDDFMAQRPDLMDDGRVVF